MSENNSQQNEKNPVLYEFSNDDGIIVKVRKGTRGNTDTDILVTITDSKVGDTTEKRIRHIYWLVDVLMKKEHNKELMNSFLKIFVNLWSSLDTFKSNSKENIENWIHKYLDNIELSEYESLNAYGFLTIKTLHRILMLLTGNEKSAGEETFMFKTIITRIVENDDDIYDIIAWADYSKINRLEIKWDNRR